MPAAMRKRVFRMVQMSLFRIADFLKASFLAESILIKRNVLKVSNKKK